MDETAEIPMHRIIKAHLASFVKNWGLEAEEGASQFEKFSNYSIISSRFSGSFEIDDITTGQSDDGIDGVAIVIDEEVSVSLEDTEKVFSTNRRNHDVDIIFVQSKRSESFDLGDFLKFKESILRFATQTPYDGLDEIQKNARQIFDIVLREVPKFGMGSHR